jgi:hypothetical protein
VVSLIEGVEIKYITTGNPPKKIQLIEMYAENISLNANGSFKITIFLHFLSVFKGQVISQYNGSLKISIN